MIVLGAWKQSYITIASSEQLKFRKTPSDEIYFEQIL